MKRIKIVQIGVGHDHAKPNFNAVASLKDMFELIGFVRVPGEEGLKPDFTEKHSYIPELSLEQAFRTPDLEAAVIETTDMELVKYAKLAADHGLHVFMDKAGSQSAKDFEDMLRTIYAAKKVFGIGYVLRYHPMIQKTLKETKEGKLGEAYAVEAHMSRDDKDEKRQWLEQFTGGMTYFLGCHLIDQVYAFQGIPEEIIPLNASTTPNKNNATDLGFAVLRYKNGTSFIKVCGAEPGGFARRQLVVCGSLGTVEIKPLENSSDGQRICNRRSWVRTDNDQPLAWGNEGKKENCPPYNRYEQMFKAFGQRIQNGEASTKEELTREARVHRMILSACGIPCDFKAEILL